MTMNGMYHTQSDIDRLYIPRMKGRRGLLSIGDCAETEEHLSEEIFLYI